MTSEKVSIIIPLLASSEHLANCLDSIKAQTLRPTEVIVAAGQGVSVPQADGAKVITSTKTKTSDILNEVIPLLEGDVLMIVNAQDVLAPTFLQENVSALQQHNSEAVMTAVRVFQDARLISPAPESVVELLASPAQPLPFLFRRSLFNTLKGYNPAAAPFELTDFVVRATQDSDKVTRLKSPLYFYRATQQTELPSNFDPFVSANAALYQKHLGAILEAKEKQVRQLEGQLAPQCERLRTDLETLQFEHESVNKKYESLAEHHRQALSSIKVTFTHLLKAITSKVLPRTS